MMMKKSKSKGKSGSEDHGHAPPTRAPTKKPTAMPRFSDPFTQFNIVYQDVSETGGFITIEYEFDNMEGRIEFGPDDIHEEEDGVSFAVCAPPPEGLNLPLSLFIPPENTTWITSCGLNDTKKPVQVLTSSFVWFFDPKLCPEPSIGPSESPTESPAGTDGPTPSISPAPTPTPAPFGRLLEDPNDGDFRRNLAPSPAGYASGRIPIPISE